LHTGRILAHGASVDWSDVVGSVARNDEEVVGMGGKKKTQDKLPDRKPILAALMDGPDTDAVLRLSITAEPDGHWVIAATLQLVDTLPTYVLSHALNDAKRRVREILGDTVEIYIEPELVRDSSDSQPATDVIVIKASD